MFLQALTAFYDRLAADPESGVAAYGYSRQQVAFVVVVNADGTLHEVQNAQVQDDQGKARNRVVEVCGNSKPSGSGINPCFLWDNAAYALGYKPDDPKPERTRESFEAFRDRHVALESKIEDSGFGAVCRFLRSWDPARGESLAVLKEAPTGFGVFRVRGETHYVHDAEPVRQWWEAQHNAADSEAVVGRCFVTGQVGPLARLHEPKIKGVFGGQSSGAALVSFNLDAFNSYGKQQSYNAPLTELTAFKYCTALNWLLDPARNRRLSIGDTSVVFWTDQPTPAEDLFAGFVAGGAPAEDEAKTQKLRDRIDRLAHGELPADLGDLGTPFYLLGLSPNAARISVRFWLTSTLGEMLQNVGRHYADLAIARGPNDQPHPPLWRLLRETVRDAKDIPDLLEGALTRAVLSGGEYPQMFFSALLRRVRADREMRHVRAAAIKAFLNRNHQLDLPMSLDPERPETAYQLGRLFAELEKTQQDALPGINDTIKDRYFGAASSTPGSVFPRLIRMSQHHLGKLDVAKRVYHERRVQEIANRVVRFPMHLSMSDQGLFAIGYYHQRQDQFTKKTDDAAAPAEAASTER